MKKNQIILGAVLISALATGLQSCQKQNPSIKNSSSETAVDNTTSASQRMWATGKQLYAIGHNASAQALLYKLTPPPFATGLLPSVVSGFSVGTTPVTNASGIAYVTNRIVISTSPSSNFPNSIMIYSSVAPYNAPVISSCTKITDIEYSEYDSKLYGIQGNSQIVQINPSTGVTVVNLTPTPITGTQVKGLCNYNGLLSFSMSDNTTALDNFYSYNPSFPSMPPVLFSTDWGVGNGGMQYCDGYGWAIVSNNDFKKMVAPVTYAVSGPLSLAGAPYMITDLTSD
jgi:hypothetical protein